MKSAHHVGKFLELFVIISLNCSMSSMKILYGYFSFITMWNRRHKGKGGNQGTTSKQVNDKSKSQEQPTVILDQEPDFPTSVTPKLQEFIPLNQNDFKKIQEEFKEKKPTLNPISITTSSLLLTDQNSVVIIGPIKQYNVIKYQNPTVSNFSLPPLITNGFCTLTILQDRIKSDNCYLGIYQNVNSF